MLIEPIGSAKESALTPARGAARSPRRFEQHRLTSWRDEMSAMKHLVWAAGLAVALLGSTATKAEAAYASVVVRNPGDVTIHYQIKWGSGEWKNYSVEPGERRYHAWDLDEDDDV